MATGQPEITTVGSATMDMLARLGLLEVVVPKLIYAQTVSQAVDYAARGEVDAALAWSSEAAARAGEVRQVATADPDWYEEVDFVIGIVNASKAQDLGSAFIDLVISPEGRTILERHGFLLP